MKIDKPSLVYISRTRRHRWVVSWNAVPHASVRCTEGFMTLRAAKRFARKLEGRG